MRIASASSLKRKSGATGPKISSRAMRMSGVTSATMVGSKKVRPSACGLPPQTMRAPLAVASASSSSTLATAAWSISGPWLTPSSTPLPTLSAETATASFSAKAS